MGAYLEAIARGERSAAGEGARHRGVLEHTSNALALRLYLLYEHKLKALAKRVDDPRCSSGVDDLVQEGLMGLIEAWHVFDEGRSGGSRDVMLWPYAFSRVRGSMVDEVRRTANFSRHLRHYHMEQYEAFRHEEKEGYEPTDDKRDRFLAWLRSVPHGQAHQMISLYILNGLSMRSIGKVYGVSEGRVNQVIHKLVREFRSKMQ